MPFPYVYKYINASLLIHSMLLVHVYDIRTDHVTSDRIKDIICRRRLLLPLPVFLVPCSSLLRGRPGEITPFCIVLSIGGLLFQVLFTEPYC